MYARMPVCMYACMFLCMYICMYVYMHACMHVCTRIHMYSLHSWHFHHTLQLSACEFTSNLLLAFESHMTDHNSQVVRFSTFMFILNDYTESGGEIYNTIHVFPLTYERQLTFTEGTCITCAITIRNWFLLSGHTSFMLWQ